MSSPNTPRASACASAKTTCCAPCAGSICYWANSPDLLADRARFDGDETGFWSHYSHRQLVALGASSKQAADMAAPMHALHDGLLTSLAVWSPRSSHAVLGSLQAADITLGVISNRRQPFVDELADLGLAPYFPYSLAGGEIGIWKPDPGIFLHACEQTGVDRSEAAYVGDNYFADVVGARAAGLMPVLYDPRGIFDDPECAVITCIHRAASRVGHGFREAGHESLQNVDGHPLRTPNDCL